VLANFSTTPLALRHAQYLRLSGDLVTGRVVEQPAAIVARYLGCGLT
jgi:hypothetical protein